MTKRIAGTSRKFSSVIIIYNPKSTGNSRTGAKSLERRLKKSLKGTSIKCVPTEYSGHAEELAYKYALSMQNPLIISSSGDGGYHEVINGVMRASAEGKPAICAVLPAGNANDHSRTMQDRPLWKSIIKGENTQIDLLQVTIETPKGKISRYAHSYIGLGLTPLIAAELNRHTLNAFKEMILAVKTFYRSQPVSIRRKGKVIALDSLIFTNINKMAKVLRFAKKNRPDDGLFEVVSFPHGHKILLVKKLLKAATVGLKTTHQEREYEFEALKGMSMQLDGEVMTLEPGSRVHVVAATKALSTII